jgi:hypothetical protein
MESINPNDIMTLDMAQISYVTMKNGNMILIDDSIPQKSNKESNKNSPLFTTAVPETNIKKDIHLEISSPSTFSFKGNKIISNNKSNKSNFNICSEISKNISFSFDAIKENKKRSSNESSSSSSSSSNKPSVKEGENQTTNNMKNNNNIEISKIDKINYNQSNLNTNLSIPIMNFSNNIIDNKNNTNINIISNDNNNNISNSSLNRRKSRASRIFGGGTARKGKISINAVCTLNIKGEEKTSINLINQFNSIVDKLNAEREKKPVYELNENEKNRYNVKYYPYYKDKTNSNIKKNKELLNQNLTEGNNDFNNGIIRRNSYALNNYNSINSFDLNGTSFKNTIGLKTFSDNFAKSPGKLSFTRYKNFRDSTYKYSSDLVLPSNKMNHLFK